MENNGPISSGNSPAKVGSGSGETKTAIAALLDPLGPVDAPPTGFAEDSGHARFQSRGRVNSRNTIGRRDPWPESSAAEPPTSHGRVSAKEASHSGNTRQASTARPSTLSNIETVRRLNPARADWAVPTAIATKAAIRIILARTEFIAINTGHPTVPTDSLSFPQNRSSSGFGPDTYDDTRCKSRVNNPRAESANFAPLCAKTNPAAEGGSDWNRESRMIFAFFHRHAGMPPPIEYVANKPLGCSSLLPLWLSPTRVACPRTSRSDSQGFETLLVAHRTLRAADGSDHSRLACGPEKAILAKGFPLVSGRMPGTAGNAWRMGDPAGHLAFRVQVPDPPREDRVVRIIHDLILTRSVSEANLLS